MLSVDDIVSDVLRREGGYVDDPDDPGGATNHGITIATLQKLGIDIDQDGDVDKDDVQMLSLSQASDIFKKYYLIGSGISDLPHILQPSVFDMYVNSGNAAIRILQKLLGQFGYPVIIDGVLGPKTKKAAFEVVAVAPNHIVDAYGIERRNFYYKLADRRPRSRKYARRKDGGKGGWITRAEEFVSERFRFTITQHKQRVAGWG